MKYILANEAGRYVSAFRTKDERVTYLLTPTRALAEEFDGSLDWLEVERRLQQKLRPVFVEYSEADTPF
jgi:hypothetical protein